MLTGRPTPPFNVLSINFVQPSLNESENDYSS
jgi:hypothetical protein